MWCTIASMFLVYMRDLFMHVDKIITMLATCSCAGLVSCVWEGPILNSVQSQILTLNIFWKCPEAELVL